MEANNVRERCAALSAVVAASEDGVSVTDRRGNVLYENAALRRLLTAEPDRRALEEAIGDARSAALARAETRRLAGEGASETPRGVRASSGDHAPSADAVGPSVTLQIRTSRSEYRTRGTTVHAFDVGRDEGLVVVWVRRCRPRHLTLDALRERYGLTPREARVASLVAARSGSREIAEALGISPHTARRHAEAVLKKLGVHSRADVRDRLRE